MKLISAEGVLKIHAGKFKFKFKFIGFFLAKFVIFRTFDHRHLIISGFWDLIKLFEDFFFLEHKVWLVYIQYNNQQFVMNFSKN